MSGIKARSMVAIALVATGALLIGGCGSGEETTASNPSTGASPNAAQAKPLDPKAFGTKAQSYSSSIGPSYFVLPSRNIGCAVYSGGARCDIGERDWPPPRRPRSCEFDWGNGVEVTGRSRGRILCASDTTLGAREVLGYGQAAKRGAFLCTSSSAGVNCTNIRSRHGFFLSRQSYGLF
jgi:uncharacterized protein DUF6636